MKKKALFVLPLAALLAGCGCAPAPTPSSSVPSSVPSSSSASSVAKVVGIEIDSFDCDTFYVGEIFKAPHVTVKKVYDDQSTVTLIDGEFTADFSKVTTEQYGKYPVTVKATIEGNDFEDTADINVVWIDKIALNKDCHLPSTCPQNHHFDPIEWGFIVDVTMGEKTRTVSDEDQIKAAFDSFDYDDYETGKQTFHLRYLRGQEVELPFEVTVIGTKSQTPTRIELKEEYYAKKFDFANRANYSVPYNTSIKAFFADTGDLYGLHRADIDVSEITGAATPGTYNIKYTYGGLTITQPVELVDLTGYTLQTDLVLDEQSVVFDTYVVGEKMHPIEFFGDAQLYQVYKKDGQDDILVPFEFSQKYVVMEAPKCGHGEVGDIVFTQDLGGGTTVKFTSKVTVTEPIFQREVGEFFAASETDKEAPMYAYERVALSDGQTVKFWNNADGDYLDGWVLEDSYRGGGYTTLQYVRAIPGQSEQYKTVEVALGDGHLSAKSINAKDEGRHLINLIGDEYREKSKILLFTENNVLPADVFDYYKNRGELFLDQDFKTPVTSKTEFTKDTDIYVSLFA